MSDEFADWMRLGIDRGWCGAPVCLTHDGIPTTAAEDLEFDSGDDICITMCRVYSNAAEQRDVESNHAPTNWRNRYNNGDTQTVQQISDTISTNSERAEK